MKVILDNGHGENTPGKRSPKGDLLEYEFNRDIVNRIADLLICKGILFYKLVPEQRDVSLKERCLRANKYHQKHKDCFLISVHANGGGGSGWEVFTSVGETESDNIATVFYEQANIAFHDFRMRKDTSDGDPDKEAHFYILKHTTCPAILTENFFMDTEYDLAFIKSDTGRQRIAQMHFDSIVEYMSQKGC
jgi:N-acetylmuramoyl-L-alanine amidase